MIQEGRYCMKWHLKRIETINCCGMENQSGNKITFHIHPTGHGVIYLSDATNTLVEKEHNIK
jgi:hypothetical protein